MTVRREIVHGSPEYERAVAIRERILRAPLGLRFSPEELEGEGNSRHLALFDGEEIVAVAVVAPGEQAKIRQVAVVASRRGEGLGREIMVFAEEVARTAGGRRSCLHARSEVVPFYLGLGYAVEGEPFEEVGIPHLRMVKPL